MRPDKKYYQNQMEEELDAVYSFEKKKKRKLQEIDQKITDRLDPRKTQMVVEFNGRESTSIKSFAVKNISEIKVTS